MKLYTPTILLTAVAVLLIVAGFIVPPMGVIDGSVISAVGELIAFAALLTLWHAIDKGIDAKFSHGNTTLELTNDDDEDNE